MSDKVHLCFLNGPEHYKLEMALGFADLVIHSRQRWKLFVWLEEVASASQAVTCSGSARLPALTSLLPAGATFEILAVP